MTVAAAKSDSVSLSGIKLKQIKAAWSWDQKTADLISI